MVACETVNEYHSIQLKLNWFYSEEQAERAALVQLTSSKGTRNPIQRRPLGHDAVVRLAKANQKQQAKKTKPHATTRGNRGKDKKLNNSRATTFGTKSEEAALKYCQSPATREEKKRKMLYSSSSENKKFLKSTPDSIKMSNTLKNFNIRDNLLGSNVQKCCILQSRSFHELSNQYISFPRTQ